MEDIKILEDYLLGKKMQYGSGYIYFREFVALENLIKGYRELEEENATLKKANNIAENVKVDDLTQAMYKSYEDFMKKYIPKSKVKEIIEQLDYRCNSNLERVCKKEILQELMEDK